MLSTNIKEPNKVGSTINGQMWQKTVAVTNRGANNSEEGEVINIRIGFEIFESFADVGEAKVS
ncbi:MAG: hypothetical protein ACTJGV_17845 [Proteus vulgaris]